MIAIKQYDGTNIIEFTLDGCMTHEEFDKIAEKMLIVLRQHEKIRLIEVIKDEPSVMWRDMKKVPKHLKNFSHIAVVADQKWIEWISRITKPVVCAELRIFKLDEIENAREWIKHV